MKVVHLTSVHTRYDTRIFLKQCRSLAAAGYDVSLVVADGFGDEVKDNVKIIDIGVQSGRLKRVISGARGVVKKGLDIDADIYHLHDPELLLGALRLKRNGKRVIFDSHEDVPLDILSKTYIKPFLRGPLAAAAGILETIVCRRLDHVVAATPAIEKKFTGLGIKSTVINNFPILGELDIGDKRKQNSRRVCYVGGIASARGIREVVSSLSRCSSGARLALAGNFAEHGLLEELASQSGWTSVDDLGFLTREGVSQVLSSSVAGIVTLHPTPAYLESLPIKMFEYMSAGLPVIASNFPLWREIIDGSNCGVCVDPRDADAIADAIDSMINDQDNARQLGENGRRAVYGRYNWTNEADTLVSLYDRLS